MQDIRKSSSWWILAAKPHDQSVFFFLGRPDSLTPASEKTLPQQESDTVLLQCVVKKMNRDAFISSQCPVLNGWTVYSFFFYYCGQYSENLAKFLLEGLTLGPSGLHEHHWVDDFTSEPCLWLSGPCCHGVSVQGEVWKVSLCLMIVWYYTIILHSDITPSLE